MKTRITSSALIIAMLAGLMSGCGGNTGSTSTSTSTSASTSTSTSTSTSASTSSTTAVAAANEFGWVVPEKPIVFGVFNASGSDAPTEGDKSGRETTAKYLKDKFNVDIKVEYTAGDGKEALNLMLAAGNYPEVIYNIPQDLVRRFAEQGKAQDMAPYLDTVGTNIKTMLGDLYPMYLDDNQKLWGVPTSMGALMDLPDYSAHIRYDEWQAIGSPEIKTPDDYYNALNKVLEQFPTTPNGETRYLMSLYDQGDPEQFCGYWGLTRGYKISDDGKFTYWAFTDEGKEMTKFFNRFYREGKMDPDAFINKFDEWKAKFSNERVVGAIGGWWISYNAGHEVWKALDPDLPDDKRYIQVGFKAPEAKSANLTAKNLLGGANRTIITDKATDVEGIMKFIDFEATRLGQQLIYWGIPNGTPVGDTGETIKAWDLKEDGSWSIDPAAKEMLITETWNYNNELYMQGFPQFISNVTRWDDGMSVWLNQMWYDENKWKSIMVKNLAGTVFDATPTYIMNKNEQTVLTEQAIKDAWKMNWPNVVQTKTDAEFDAAWDTLQQSLKSAGIDQQQTTMEENYKANLAKMK